MSEWINVKEKLPKNDDWKIVTILDENGDTPYRYVGFGRYLESANCWIVDNERRTDIVAWTNLPTPYEEPKTQKVEVVYEKSGKFHEEDPVTGKTWTAIQYTATNITPSGHKTASWTCTAEGLVCSRCGYKLTSTGLPSHCPHCLSWMKFDYDEKSYI